ncbi:unnamed protein product [Gordionus sp. m RMFG-2023]
MDVNYLPTVYLVLFIVILTLGVLINGAIFVLLRCGNFKNRVHYFLSFLVSLNVIYCAVSLAIIKEHVMILWDTRVTCYHDLKLKKFYMIMLAGILNSNQVLIACYFYDKYLSITRNDIKLIRDTNIYNATPYVVLAVFFPPNITSYFMSIKNKDIWVQTPFTPFSYACNYTFSSKTQMFNIFFDLFTLFVSCAALTWIVVKAIRTAIEYSHLVRKPYVINFLGIDHVTTDENRFKILTVTGRRFLRKILTLFSLMLIFSSLNYPKTFHYVIYFFRCKLGACPPLTYSSSQMTFIFLEMASYAFLPILFVLTEQNLRKYFRH